MTDDRRGRLERYLRNSDLFLWGIWRDSNHTNRTHAYEWLEASALRAWPEFKFSKRAAYDDVEDRLIRTVGIERLVEDLVIPTVEKTSIGRHLDELRRAWLSGQHPSSQFLRNHGLKDGEGWPILLEASYPFKPEKYVSGWTPFAGVWFEEVEHLDD